MNYFLNVLLACAVLFPRPVLYGQHANDTIHWGTKELDWKDFQKQPPIGPHGDAATCTVLHLQMDPKLNEVIYTVEALFLKSKSWVSHKRPLLLEHEKGHFDIAELYARKLRKQLQTEEFLKRDYEERALTLYRISNQQMDRFHDMYDKQTNFSKNEKAQREWEIVLAAKLDSLIAYKQPIVRRTFKQE